MPGEGFVGANVTVPHKDAALAVADSLDARPRREIGAANTLSFEAGEIEADNTDARRPARLRCPRRRRAAGRWCSAPAAPPGRSVWALLREGAEVEVWNRTAAAVRRHLCEELGGEAGRRQPRGRPPTT